MNNLQATIDGLNPLQSEVELAEADDEADISDGLAESVVSEVSFFRTDVVDVSQRLDYWIDTCSKALAPIVATSRETINFHCELTLASLDALDIIQARGSQQDSARTRECLAADVAHSYHLMVDYSSSWSLKWRGTEIHLRPGDLIITDSRYLHSGCYQNDCCVLNIKMLPIWALTWLRHPDRIAGRLIARDAGWGTALSAFVAQISPCLAADAPLPPRLIAQNLGALLSLVEAEMFAQPAPVDVAHRQTRKRVADAVRQRSGEPGLTAVDVATMLGISERTLHRSLAGSGQTFAQMLVAQRMEQARRMLEAKHFDRLTTGEIGSRAGFADPSYFVRTATRHLGMTPARFRAALRR